MMKPYGNQRRYTRRDILRGAGLAASALAVAPVIAACGGGGNKSSAGATDRSAKPVLGGTLTVRDQADVGTLDYAYLADLISTFVVYQSVEHLLDITPAGQIEGVLATSWENPDARTYIFKLRQGIKFQDGTGFDASAVEYSLNRIRQDKSSPWYQDLAGIDSMEKPDPNTVKIALGQPFAPFLTNGMATRSGSAISPATAEAFGKDKLRVDLTGVGTGPFRFVEWKKDDHLTLVRNEDYWGRDAAGTPLPYLGKIVMRPISDATAALDSLRTGEIDAFRPTEGPPGKDVSAIKADPSLSLSTVQSTGFQYIALNAAKDPLSSTALRQAISHAIDREAIVKSFFGDQGKPLDVILPAASWAYDSDYHPYAKRDLNRAKQLLAQAGKPNGFTFPLMFVATGPAQQLAELIQDQLKEAGIGITPQQVDNPKLIQATLAGEHAAALMSWGAGADPDGALYAHFSSHGGRNAYSHYHNADVDDLLEQARSTLEMNRRTPLYQRAQRLIMADAPYCVLYPLPYSSFTSSKVRNYPLPPGGAVGLSLRGVWKQA